MIQRLTLLILSLPIFLIISCSNVSNHELKATFLFETVEKDYLVSEGKIIKEYSPKIRLAWINRLYSLASIDRQKEVLQFVDLKKDKVLKKINLPSAFFAQSSYRAIDFSAKRIAAYTISDFSLLIYNIEENKIEKHFSEKKIRELLNVELRRDNGFVSGIALHPNKPYIFIFIRSLTEFEESSGTPRTLTYMIDYQTDKAKLIGYGSPVYVLSNDTVLCKDLDFIDGKEHPMYGLQQSAYLYNFNGTLLGRIDNIYDVSSDNEHIFLLRRIGDPETYEWQIEVWDMFLKEQLKAIKLEINFRPDRFIPVSYN